MRTSIPVFVWNMIFQNYLMTLQLQHEKIFYEAAQYIEGFDKILIVCDRGLLDGKVYISKEDLYCEAESIGMYKEIYKKDLQEAISISFILFFISFIFSLIIPRS